MVPLFMMIAYLTAKEVLEANFNEGWFTIPAELRGPTQYPYLFAELALAVVILLFLAVIIILIYALVYRIIGPPRYGPLDAPPPRKRPPRRRK